jgi:hypothetical protein
MSKSYDTLQLILTGPGGYPDVPVPQNNDWLEQMVRAGAKWPTRMSRPWSTISTSPPRSGAPNWALTRE